MHEISNEQIRDMQSHRIRAFVERLIERWRDTDILTESRLDTTDASEVLTLTVERAIALGVDDDANLERLLLHVVRHGKTFGLDDATDWVQSVLTDFRLTATEKLNEIDRLTFLDKRQNVQDLHN